MTNGLKVGDEVMVPGIGYPIIGKIVELDDHPLEYAEMKIEVQGAGGTVEIWKSCRMARKVNP